MNMLYDNRRACEVASKDKPVIKGFFHRWITEAYTIDPVLVGRQPGQVMYTTYYVVTDTATGKGVEGYGCDTLANHRADALNRESVQESRRDEGSTNDHEYD